MKPSRLIYFWRKGGRQDRNDSPIILIPTSIKYVILSCSVGGFISKKKKNGLSQFLPWHHIQELSNVEN